MMSCFVAFFLSATLLSCDKDVDAENDLRPILSFCVKTSGGVVYDALIDYDKRTIVVPDIENTKAISQVEYTLAEGAKMDPDPNDFLGKWNKNQKVCIVTRSKNTYIYTISFPAFNPNAIIDDVVEEELPPSAPTTFTKLIFSDEFNNLDVIPDINKWDLCEKQTVDWNEEMSESYDQAYVQDGKLVLIAEKKGDAYYAGGVKSKFSFTFGRVEVCARISRYPNGAFPAIWMMPSQSVYQGWPYCGEIDIMEHIKQESVIYQTVHTHYTYDLNIKNPPNSATYYCSFFDYRVYAMEWTKNELTFFVDGQKTFSYPNLKLPSEVENMQWPFTEDAAFYLILNMGLGRNDGNSWAGPINDAALPAKMEIDWVRIYQEEDL